MADLLIGQSQDQLGPAYGQDDEVYGPPLVQPGGDYVDLIVASSMDDFQAQAQGNALDLPDGTPIKFTVKLPWYMPIAGIANIAGAEWWAQHLSPEHVIVDDVNSPDAHTIVVEAHVMGYPVVLLAGVILAALITLGIAYTLTEIRLSADRNATAQAQANLASQLSQQHPDWSAGDISSVVGATSPAANQPASGLSDISGIVKFAVIGLIAFAGIQALGSMKSLTGART